MWLSFKLEPHSDIEIQIQFPESRLGTLLTPFPSVVNRELAYPHPVLSIHRTMLSIVDLIGIAGEDEQIHTALVAVTTLNRVSTKQAARAHSLSLSFSL